MSSQSLLTLGGLAFALASCGSFKNFNQPISNGGDFDPLSSPGSNSRKRSAVVAPTSPSYKPGQWVETSMPNSTFFRLIPKGNARADMVLAAGTDLKVVSSKGTYVKVELDSGEVGYVPEIMVIERSSANAVPVSSPLSPVPEFGSVPPPVDPSDFSGDFAPPPEIPGITPSVPVVPSLPDAPPVPEVGTPPVLENVPTVPDVAPPPEIPGITDPVKID
ncbi:MAG: hypothetical protein ACJAQT_001016 [Akkermansiaceae bacterium]|jgi:hypothetical protein